MLRDRAFRSTESPEPVQNLATEKQQNFIQTLLGEKDLRAEITTDSDDEYTAVLETMKAQVPTLTKKSASKWIESLLTFPKVKTNGSAPTSPQVPDGRYALREDGDLTNPADGRGGIVKFFKVNSPTEGRWAGYTFVDAQASDDLHPIRNRDHKAEILTLIAQNPKAAMLLYGQELGHCGHCNRTLTDETSRELGVGPVCREKLGW